MTNEAVFRGHLIPYAEAAQAARIGECLDGLDWRIVGTFPLGIDVPGSDIDIVCEVGSYDAFSLNLWDAFRDNDAFAIRQWISKPHCVVCDFVFAGWPFQIFGEQRNVEQQTAWRHFRVEQRLLELGGEQLRLSVMQERNGGLKTEPAFAKILGLAGDPYQAMLGLFGQSDDELRQFFKAPLVKSFKTQPNQ